MLLGSEKAAKKFRSLISGESSKDRLENKMEDVRKVLRLSAKEFENLKRPLRGIVRLMRDIAIYLIWKQVSFPLAEIGEKFHVGYTSISNTRIRGDAALREDR